MALATGVVAAAGVVDDPDEDEEELVVEELEVEVPLVLAPVAPVVPIAAGDGRGVNGLRAAPVRSSEAPSVVSAVVRFGFVVAWLIGRPPRTVADGTSADPLADAGTLALFPPNAT